jgi:hypothetical protein
MSFIFAHSDVKQAGSPVPWQRLLNHASISVSCAESIPISMVCVRKFSDTSKFEPMRMIPKRRELNNCPTEYFADQQQIQAGLVKIEAFTGKCGLSKNHLRQQTDRLQRDSVHWYQGYRSLRSGRKPTETVQKKQNCHLMRCNAIAEVGEK